MMASRRLLQIVFLCWSVTIGLCEVSERLSFSRCTNQQTCGDCISSHPECAWCKQESFQQGHQRCSTAEELSYAGCSEANIVSPVSKQTVTQDRLLSRAHRESERAVNSDKKIHISPRRIKMLARAREKQTFTLQYRQVEDYPLDLYYLMDLTSSMYDDKNTLAGLGDDLANALKNLTANYRIGFGSFVDKPVMPYIDTLPKVVEDPCLAYSSAASSAVPSKCSSPYGFRNHLSLTQNVEEFIQKVSQAQMSGNLDNAEGSLDAIMQSVVCKKQIGWQPGSRRLIVFVSDGIFHIAGDGKLGGAVENNDGTCHVDFTGYDKRSTVKDYPSVAAIDRVILNNKVSVMFAVPAKWVPMYEQLSQLLRGKTTVAVLESDSSNIIQLLQQEYDHITSTVTIQANSTEGVSMRYFSKCLGEKRFGTNTCKGIRFGDTIDFEIELQIKKCPKNEKNWTQTISISETTVQESLILELDMLCGCDCESSQNTVTNSSRCSHEGDYQCGICSCHNDRFGRECECDPNDEVNTEDYLQLCRTDNSTVKELCSGRGDCVCGVCQCFGRSNPEEQITGPQCQCDNFSCDKSSDGLICGGSDHGECDCGECECLPGWMGNDCTCASTNDTCILPDGDGVACSGKGQCECGSCICDETENGRYGGVYCEECPTCTHMCTVYKDCVLCQAFGSGKHNAEECEAQCVAFSVIKVPVFMEEKRNQRFCQFIDPQDSCIFEFSYNFDSTNNPVVSVLLEKHCPEPVSVLALSLGIIGSILLIGVIVLLVWRTCVYFKDKQDYERFQEEVKQSKFEMEENPLFKPAVTKYVLPESIQRQLSEE